MEYFLGIDIGGTKCAVVVGDSNFRIHQKIQFDTKTGERGYLAVLEEFFKHIENLFLIYPKKKPHGNWYQLRWPSRFEKGDDLFSTQSSGLG